MKKTIKTNELIKVAKHFMNKSKEYKKEGKDGLSRYYETLVIGIESVLKATAVDADQYFTEGFNEIHKSIWGE